MRTDGVDISQRVPQAFDARAPVLRTKQPPGSFRYLLETLAEIEKDPVRIEALRTPEPPVA